MTTVVYRDGVLAFDEQVSCGWSRAGVTRKGHIIGPYLVGIAGELPLASSFLDWLSQHLATHNGLIPFPKDYKVDDDDHFTAIVINGAGEVWMYETAGAPYRIDGPFFTLGSGGNIATGALHMGASAEEAVQAAICWDAGSGGRVHSLNIKDLPKPKKGNVVPLRGKKKPA